MMDRYLQSLERWIHALGKLVNDFQIDADRRDDEFLFLRGEIKFADGSFLHFREYVELKEGQPPRLYKYAYHYQRAEESVIFRYDNAKHFSNLPGAPHHKHISETDVIATQAPTLQSILQEIERLISS